MRNMRQPTTPGEILREEFLVPLGMTQKQLAEAVGITGPYLSQIEIGARSGQTSVITAIAEALDVTLDDLKVDYTT
jgi:addiction module HigA family antidote